MRIQSHALRTGDLFQKLGALLLELGRTTMTLRMGQTAVGLNSIWMRVVLILYPRFACLYAGKNVNRADKGTMNLG